MPKFQLSRIGVVERVFPRSRTLSVRKDPSDPTGRETIEVKGPEQWFVQIEGISILVGSVQPNIAAGDHVSIVVQSLEDQT